MKKIFFLFIMSSITITAQWFWQNPYPTGNSLRSVQFVNNNIGWAVGDLGTIIKTTDGGENWIRQESGTTEQLMGVSLLNNNYGFVAGYYWVSNAYPRTTIILRTTNGGGDWEAYTSDTTRGAYNIEMIDSNNIVAVGYQGSIIKSTNGGYTWEDHSFQTTNTIQAVYFKDSNNGIAVGDYGMILKTIDGGATWTQKISGTNYFLFDVTFINQDIGLAVGGYGTILKTTDGGNSWISKTSGTTWWLYGICFYDEYNGVIVGHGWPIILKTSDQGESWITQSSGISNTTLWSVSCPNGNDALTVGGEGYILKTTNRGLNWIQKNRNVVQKGKAVFFADQSNGAIVGWDGNIFNTTNGGDEWIPQVSGTTNPLHDVYFINSEIGVVVGDNGNILRTTNGGDTWSLQIIQGSYSLRKVSFFDDNNGWIFGYYYLPNQTSYLILKSSDAGLSWETTFTDSLSDIYFFDVNQAIGINKYTHKLLNSIDGGNTWTQEMFSSDYQFIKIIPINSTTCFVIATGPNYLRFKTTNKGATWAIEDENNGQLWGSEAISFFDEQNGYISGAYGKIYKTTDGAETWEYQYSGTSSYLADIIFIDVKTAIAVGGSTVIKTTNGGGNFTENELDNPSNFLLEQNYPNPFNPSTTIKYEIPEISFVTIKVYDILGREVATLVNVQKPAGSYEVQFDGFGLTSGIYFYQLKAGVYSETKKMILLK